MEPPTDGIPVPAGVFAILVPPHEIPREVGRMIGEALEAARRDNKPVILAQPGWTVYFPCCHQPEPSTP